MNSRYTSISKMLVLMQMYIHNAAEQADIQKKMNQMGFTPKRMQEGKVLLEDFKMLYGHQTDKYDEKKKLIGQIKDHEELARQTLVDHVDTIRYIFRKDEETLNELNVVNISRKFDEWSLQAALFYNKVAKYTEVLTPHGLSLPEIAQAQAMVEAVATVRNRHMLRKGEAEEATRIRDEKLKALKAWMKDFRAIARVALQDSPQLLEAIGIVVKSKKPSRKKQNP